MDLDYALRVDAPAALTAESSTEQKAAYEKWDRSNRISLMIMKGSITTAIRGAIPDSDNAKLYLAHIEEQFQGSSKAHATTLITKMVTLKYSGSNGVREHILRMNGMASQLKGLDMEISEGFLVHFIMTSLSAQFGPFKINYNTQKEKWKMSELISMCVQEEERLKSEQPDSAHVAITDPSKGKRKVKKFGKGNVQGNRSASVTKTDKASSSGTNGSSGPMCHFCKDKGHMRKECHKCREWLEKKGATVHITNSLHGFLSVKKLNKRDRNVLVGNGEKAQVKAVGTLRLVLESGFNLDLVDTVYVPSMTRNLISVSRLDAYGYSFKFENKGFSLFFYSRVIGSGLLEGNLYKLLLNASFTESLKTMNVNDVVAKTCDAEYSGSCTPRIINLEEIQDHVSIPVIQKVGAPLPHREDNDAPEVVPNDVPLITDPAPIPANEQPLRSDMHMSHETKNFMSKNFDMKDLGEASYVIGIEIHRDRSRGILGLSQRAYIEKVLKRNQLEQDEMERIPYALAVGSLMYAQVCTRPDIAHVVGMLGRYQINPGMGHWKVAKKVMRYLQGTKDFMLIYRKSDNLEVIGYSDFDYTGCVDTLKSTSGYVFMLAEEDVSWKSAKQPLVASHTMEAEFVACFEASCHGVWCNSSEACPHNQSLVSIPVDLQEAFDFEARGQLVMLCC
ncbi:hypothetical protein RJ640_003616 [Escallonia rubra]|uniref:Uncharacterized protein n=1 Tax=Escallonia rubra TaxID=112253 RepID=A0AA88U9J4_9ASTE|nr:hypothetical protein RJ640_003616 [Escallonia rubra]